MQNMSCVACGLSVLPSMRICPQCGGRNFSESSIGEPMNADVTPSPSLNLNSGMSWSGADTHEIKLRSARNFPRLIASFIDAVVLGGLYFGAFFVLGVVWFFFGDINDLDIESIIESDEFFRIYQLVGAVAVVVYFAFQHASKYQATFGKRLMRLKLVTNSGGLVTHTGSVLRILIMLAFSSATNVFFFLATSTQVEFGNRDFDVGIGTLLIYLLTIFVLALGPYITVFGNAQHKTLFDMICKTRVVEA